MSARSRRVTSDDERALFYETFSDVKPLRSVIKPARAKKAATPKAEATAKPAQRKAAPKPKPKTVADAPPEIGGHRATSVRKGRIEPEARLDLHGQTQEAAHRTLLRFLERAKTSGARVVLVIPGKSGVLNREFKRWLAQGAFVHLVAGVSSAHRRHGGGGAFYVLIKRARM